VQTHQAKALTWPKQAVKKTPKLLNASLAELAQGQQNAQADKAALKSHAKGCGFVNALF